MIPTSTGKTNPCDPISSNCVIWQGPDISCIDLCKGDTVSDVVAKLAQELCDLIDATCQCEPDVGEVLVKCVMEEQPTSLDLPTLLQAIIDHLCSITPSPTEELVADLPSCLFYEVGGITVTQLPIVDYAEYLANAICSLTDTIQTINTTLNSYDQRITLLEQQINQVPDPLMVVPQCVLNQTSVPVETLLLAVELQFCNLRQATGRQRPRLPSPRHRGAPVPESFRSRRRHARARRGTEERPALHRPRSAAARKADPESRDRPPRLTAALTRM